MLSSIAVHLLAGMLLAAQDQQPSRIEAGHKLFEKNCSACHGSEAKGGRGPDLTAARWKWGFSDAAILQNILTGIPGTQMPAFPMQEDEGRAILDGGDSNKDQRAVSQVAHRYSHGKADG